MTSVGIIGGGLSGLVCAYRLLRAGLEPVLLEKKPTLGGRARTEIVEGEPVNIGAQVISRAYKKLLRLLSEVELAGRLKKLPGRAIAIYNRGQVYESTPKGLLSAKLVGKSDILRLSAVFLQDAAEVSLGQPEDTVRRFHGMSWRDHLIKSGCSTQLIADLIDPLASFVTCNRSDEVSAAHGRFLGGEFIRSTAILEGGMGRLIEALGARLAGKVEILTAADVTEVKPNGGGVTLHYQQGGIGRQMTLDSVVSSIPVPEFNRVCPALHPMRVEYASITQLLVEGRKRSQLDGRRIVICGTGDDGILFTVDTGTITSVFARSDDCKLETVFETYRVIRRIVHEHAHPLIRPNAPIPPLCTPIPNIYVCGDFYYYPSLETAVATGELVAERLISRSG